MGFCLYMMKKADTAYITYIWYLVVWFFHSYGFLFIRSFEHYFGRPVFNFQCCGFSLMDQHAKILIFAQNTCIWIQDKCLVQYPQKDPSALLFGNLVLFILVFHILVFKKLLFLVLKFWCLKHQNWCLKFQKWLWNWKFVFGAWNTNFVVSSIKKRCLALYEIDPGLAWHTNLQGNQTKRSSIQSTLLPQYYRVLWFNPKI